MRVSFVRGEVLRKFRKIFKKRDIEFEKRYSAFVDACLIVRLRIMAIFGGIVFICYNVLDKHVYPDLAYPLFFNLRIFCCVLFIFCFLATFIPAMKRHTMLMAFVIFLFPALTIHLMIYFTEGVLSPYREGVTLVVLAWIFVNDFRILPNLIFCAFNIAAYLIVCYLHNPNHQVTDYVLPAYFSGTVIIFVATLNAINARQHKIQFKLAEKLKESERKLERSYAQVKVQAERDHLTGALNRRAFVEMLEQRMEMALVTKESFYLVFFDIDRFKRINDVYGHLVGDELIKLVVNVVTKNLRQGVEMGRYGGDEFMFIMDEMPEPTLKNRICDIQDKVKASPFFHKDEILTVNASFGAVKHNPKKIHSPEDLIRYADEAALKSKHVERGSIHIAKL